MLNIKGYDLIEQIGTGGMASVWKARQLSLDRIVAIKILGKTSLPSQEALDRFKREAQIAARLNHPAIVQVYDAGEISGEAYLVMEYVEGHTVADEILQQHGLGEARALEIASTVAKALAYAWEKECLIHCDIKPDNILIDRNSGAIKVADLGLARMIGQLERTDDQHIIGTPNYIAPEQSAGIPDLDCRTDMYALGATLYHMVTGVLPFRDAKSSAAMDNHEEGFLEDPQKINPTLSGPAAWLIEKLMLKNRALRPHFWTQVLKDFEQVRQGLMPFDPLPEEGCSTIRRASGRSSVPAAKTAGSPPEKPPAPKIKLKRTELAAAAKAPAKTAKRRSRLLESLVSLLVIGATGLAVLYYHGKLDLSGVPALSAFLERARTMVSAPPAGEEAQQEAAAEEAPGDSGAFAPESGQAVASGGAAWARADFEEGLRLLNEAQALYTEYLKTRAHPENLTVIESKSRSAIEQFEKCRADAPAHIPVDQYVRQSYGLISGSRQSMTALPAPGPASEGAAPAQEKKPKITIVSAVDNRAAPAPAPVKAVQENKAPVREAAPPKPAANRIDVLLDPAWQETPLDTAGLAGELSGLLSRYVQPGVAASVDDSTELFGGIKAMMTAFEASRILRQELPIKRTVNVPGFPARSFFYYEFEGEFSGANRLVLVVDRNNRVLMAQSINDRAGESRAESATPSARWRVVDFVRARQRSSDAEVVTHQARMRDQVIVVTTEVSVVPAGAGGPHMVNFRAQLIMPVPVAALVVQASR